MKKILTKKKRTMKARVLNNLIKNCGKIIEVQEFKENPPLTWYTGKTYKDIRNYGVGRKGRSYTEDELEFLSDEEIKYPFPLSGDYKYIPDDLHKLCVPVDSLTLLENNPRHNDKAAEKLSIFIRENGFRNPISVDQNNIIRAGNTRFKSAVWYLDMPMIPIAQSKWNNEADAIRYTVGDNKFGEIAKWNKDTVKKLFESDNKILSQKRAENCGFTSEEYFNISQLKILKKKKIDAKSGEKKQQEYGDLLDEILTELEKGQLSFVQLKYAFEDKIKAVL